MRRVVDIVDTTMRDGNQSLWSATGLTTPDVVAIAPTVDRVGFHAGDSRRARTWPCRCASTRRTPGSGCGSSRAAMPSTPLSFITTGMRFISWVPADEELMRLSFRCVVRNGIRRFQVADPANDTDRLRRLARMAREEGVEEIVIGLTYSVSPVHTHAYYAERAAALAGCDDLDRLYLKDPGGLLTPDAVRELAPHFRRAAGGKPIELHSHCTIGLAPLAYIEGVRAGFRVLHTAVGRSRVGRRIPPPRRRSATSRHADTRTGSTSTRSPRWRSTSAGSARRRGSRRGSRRSTTRPTTTTSSPAAWSRPPADAGGAAPGRAV